MKTAVLLATGFEEVEATAVIDVLRRAGVETVTAALGTQLHVTGAHGLTVVADSLLQDLQPAGLQAVVLPGGMPGSTHLAASAAVRQLCLDVHAAGGIVAAICAAPLALHAAGLLAGRRITSFPSVKDQLPGTTHTGADVEFDNRILTGKAAGTALAFAAELVARLGLPDQAATIRTSMFIP